MPETPIDKHHNARAPKDKVGLSKKVLITSPDGEKLMFWLGSRAPKDAVEHMVQAAQLAEEKTGLKYNVQYLKLKSPKNQLEIWVGR